MHDELRSLSPSMRRKASILDQLGHMTDQIQLKHDKFKPGSHTDFFDHRSGSMAFPQPADLFDERQFPGLDFG